MMGPCLVHLWFPVYNGGREPVPGCCAPGLLGDRECLRQGTQGRSLSQLRKKTKWQGGGCRTAGLPGGNVLTRCGRTRCPPGRGRRPVPCLTQGC